MSDNDQPQEFYLPLSKGFPVGAIKGLLTNIPDDAEVARIDLDKGDFIVVFKQNVESGG